MKMNKKMTKMKLKMDGDEAEAAAEEAQSH